MDQKNSEYGHLFNSAIHFFIANLGLAQPSNLPEFPQFSIPRILKNSNTKALQTKSLLCFYFELKLGFQSLGKNAKNQWYFKK